ncbi:MAG: hypothetical protein WA632_04200, partial [Gallionella sp.]
RTRCRHGGVQCNARFCGWECDMMPRGKMSLDGTAYQEGVNRQGFRFGSKPDVTPTWQFLLLDFRSNLHQFNFLRWFAAIDSTSSSARLNRIGYRRALLLQNSRDYIEDG